jgi:CCR4-NOT complex subunit CAF16
LDEITVDLDVLGRADLMGYLKQECEERNATIVYATHIFDGLESWPTHIAFVSKGRLQSVAPAEEIPELQKGQLLQYVVRLLTDDPTPGVPMLKDLESKLTWDDAEDGKREEFSYVFNNGWVPGTLASSLKNSSNAVMRG